MSSATDAATGALTARLNAPAPSNRIEAAATVGSTSEAREPGVKRETEHFIPVTRFALIDRLTRPQAWPPGVAAEVRRFFRYLDYWRHQQHNSALLELEQAYEPFSPDSDLFVTRQFTEAEREQLRTHLVGEIKRLLKQANYVRVDASDVRKILTRESHYGLDLHVDLDAFDELLIYYRGASTRKERRRTLRKFFRRQEFEVPIYRRLFVLFKLKPFEQRVEEVMRELKLGRGEAEKHVRKLRSLIPGEVRDDSIYMKLFKNMPRADLEMIFPNTRVMFRPIDKIKLWVTGGAGLGMGMVGAAGKLAVVSTAPLTAAGAAAGLGGIAFRQAMSFVNQRQRYMVIMAQNLYFHAMADNRGVMIKLADRAAEEDVKEEMLLYSVLAKEKVNRRDLTSVDEAIERYLANTFGVTVNFDDADALSRLMRDGLVTEGADGTLHTLPPREAALHIDRKWDEVLDNLPDLIEMAGVEVETSGNGAAG
jgi:hypothetical protein